MVIASQRSVTMAWNAAPEALGMARVCASLPCPGATGSDVSAAGDRDGAADEIGAVEIALRAGLACCPVTLAAGPHAVTARPPTAAAHASELKPGRQRILIGRPS